MAQPSNSDAVCRIHIAAKYKDNEMSSMGRKNISDHVKEMLEANHILHSSVLVIEIAEEYTIVQVKMNKTTINSNTLSEIESVLRRVDGHMDTWVLTETVMDHPEIYK